jgi:hypothetical protein
MGKRGRPRKKPATNVPTKVTQCYTLSSDEETGNKEKILRLPSPTQRRGVGNERGGSIVLTPPNRTTTLANVNGKKTPLKTNDSVKKKIIINGNHKKDETSGDSDATEVYVERFLYDSFVVRGDVHRD